MEIQVTDVINNLTARIADLALENATLKAQIASMNKDKEDQDDRDKTNTD